MGQVRRQQSGAPGTNYWEGSFSIYFGDVLSKMLCRRAEAMGAGGPWQQAELGLPIELVPQSLAGPSAWFRTSEDKQQIQL